MIKFEPPFLFASKLGCNKTRQKAIFLGEGVDAHFGHVACRLPLRDVASHVGVKQLLNWTLYPFGRLSWQEKRVLLLSTFSNSTIMNKNKWAILSRQ